MDSYVDELLMVDVDNAPVHIFLLAETDLCIMNYHLDNPLQTAGIGFY